MESADGVLDVSPPLENLEDRLARQEGMRGGWMLSALPEVPISGSPSRDGRWDVWSGFEGHHNQCKGWFA